MNRTNTNMLKLVWIMIVLLTLIFPTNILAKKTTSSKTCKQGDCAAACGNKLGISISAGPYSKGTSRTVKVSVNANTGHYKAIAYITDIDKNEAESSNFGDDDADNETDITKKVKTLKSEEANGTSHTFTIPAGKEALIIVKLRNTDQHPTKNETYSGKVFETDSSVYTNSKCIEKDKNNNCTKSQYFLKCGNGSNDQVKVENDAENLGEIEIKGNAASRFLQNPSEGSTVENIRYKGNEGTGTVCNNAYNGTFMSDSYPENIPKYSINGANDSVWQSSYYGKLLSYCSSQQVAFNLKETKIKKISNLMLKIYKHVRDIENSGAVDINTINQGIANIKSRYNITDAEIEETKKLIESGQSIAMQCESKIPSENYIGNQHRLYIKEDTPEIASTSKGDIKVCSTKCYEHLTVQYSPPQVVKAGLCFNYKVTIKTETQCGIDYNKDFWNGYTPKEMCSPLPICEADESKTQAGPSEEFDECIHKCDDGEYSQRCINQCYKKVYKNKVNKINKKSVSSKVQDKTNIQSDLTLLQGNNNVNDNLVMLSEADEENYYYDSNNRKHEFDPNYYIEDSEPKCNTDNLKTNLDYCVDYFYYNKLEYPMGHYYIRGGNSDTREWGPLNWDPDPEVEGDGKNKEVENVPKQIGRSSPYYLRTKEETKNLLMDLLGIRKYDDDKWRKYNINSNGIKRQYSTRWVCKEVCYYAGCNISDTTNADDTPVALTSKQYTDELIDDLNALEDALTKCKSTTACETTEKTANFYIKVSSKNENGEINAPEKNGYNTSSENPDESNKIGNGDSDMFVPADNDTDTKTGILGKCYDKRLSPHYQTTITFPGSWIDLKTGEVKYTEQDQETNRVKKQYYCTPYNIGSINEEWWKWAISTNYNTNAYPNGFNPEYNIWAGLGKGNNFGKYNWNINLKCFYSVYNGTIDQPPENCYRGDAGTEESCNNSEEGKKQMSAKLNYDIRVVSLESIFPRDRLRGYNWGSSAQLKSDDENIQTKLNNTGYGIDPVQYSKSIIGNQGGKGEEGTYTNSEKELVVTLDADDVMGLKQETLDFDGTYSNDEVVPGLRYYMMNSTFKSKYGITTTWNPGTNNK